MAKIPTYVQQGQYQAGRRAHPGDFEGGEGISAIGSAVSKTGDLSLRLFEAEMESNVFKAVANSKKELNDLLMQIEQTPDHNQRNSMYETGVKKISDKAREGLRYGAYQNQFSELFFNEEERGRVAVDNNVRQARLASIKANDMLYIEGELDSMENAADPKQAKLSLANVYSRLDEGVINGSLGPEQVAAGKIRAKNRYDQTVLLGRVQALADEINSMNITGTPADIGTRRAAVRQLAPRERNLVGPIVEEHYRMQQQELTQNRSRQNVGIRQRIEDQESPLTLPQLDTIFEKSQLTAMPMTESEYTNFKTAIKQKTGSVLSAQDQKIEKINELVVSSLYEADIKESTDPVTRGKWAISTDITAKYSPYISTDDTRIKELIKTQGKLIAGGSADVSSVYAKEINRALAHAGLPSSNAQIAQAKPDERKQELAFRRMAVDVLEKAQHEAPQTGSLLSSSDVDNLLRGLRQEITYDVDFFSNDTAPLYMIDYETHKDEIGTYMYGGPELLPSDLERIREDLDKNYGVDDPSDELIVSKWWDDIHRLQGRETPLEVREVIKSQRKVY